MIIDAMKTIPEKAHAIIVFAHGSGSGRLSPRNQYVANVLNDFGFATLLVDLLTPQEDQTYETRFDIDLLTKRLILVVKSLKADPATADLKVGFFGASTGAAAALESLYRTFYRY